MTDTSNLLSALDRLADASARAMVGRARLAAPGLNRWLARELARAPGMPGSLLADPVIEVAKAWEPGPEPLGALSPRLLSPDLVSALDSASVSRMPRDRAPYAHQLAAWQESLANRRSVLVTAGTGAGKTECFLIPLLQDCLAHPRPGGGVRAILLYPLNALIESQRERLLAWATGLGGKVRFALLNGDTPNTEREAHVKSDNIELRSRAAIRARPPEILVTNTTMLEYMLLRGTDRAILEASQGALRWMVLDEAHSYVGSQAAEMALLLRRVRGSFGVSPADVRLIATSATIGGEADAPAKLRRFAAALAGQDEAQVAVIEGRERLPDLPRPCADTALQAGTLAALPDDEAGRLLAAHPRMQTLRKECSREGQPLSRLTRLLTGGAEDTAQAVTLLEQAGRATWQGRPFLPWRAHLFHRAQGGLWACPDPGCPHRPADLAAEGAGWPFGAVYLAPRAACACGAPVYEAVSCTECGSVHLQGRLVSGAQLRLDPPEPGEGDDFALDAEPDDDAPAAEDAGTGWIAPGATGWLAADGCWFDNLPPADTRAWPFALIDRPEDRACCAAAGRSRLMGLRFGPAFLMGNGMAGLLQDLAPPARAPSDDAPLGLPAGGRRAITFTDSRQGVARLAAKLQQEAERTLTRAYLWHRVQEGAAADPAEVEKLTKKIAALKAAGLPDLAADDERALAALSGSTPPLVPWAALVDGLARHEDLLNFAGDIWRGRWLGEHIKDDPGKRAEMFIYRELFRRPRVQNNPETLGLLQLVFPKLEEKARAQTPPQPLREAGLDAEAWAALAAVAVDQVFRQSLAVDMPLWMVPLVAPRFGKLNYVVPTDARPEDMPVNSRRWPGPLPHQGRLTRLAELVYHLIGGSPDSTTDQDRAGTVLSALWDLVTSTVAVARGGSWQLSFANAAVRRIDRAFLCPVTRRPYPYSLAGRSPNDPALTMTPVDYPRLPRANAGGLTAADRALVADWLHTDLQVAALRDRGLWGDLHDRLATFPPYIRAQEHSAQIPRETLRRYEEDFANGRINLLNCSTTMEMGVDLADVRLVVNSNVPPALSNYRQRAGRAGRRGEPWAFTLTFCRDLPLDRRAFDAPTAFLQRPIAAPKVWFDSPSLVQRHVNAFLLAAWLGENGGESVTSGIGSFLGAGPIAAEPVLPDARADAFLAALEGPWATAQTQPLRDLVAGTVLAADAPPVLVARTQAAFEDFVRRWRNEHRLLLDAAATAADKDIRTAMEFRARRLAGEFLLGELARRGFTPAYGFPTDVVTFQNLRDRLPNADQPGKSFQRRGTASRPLDQAIREYAPGAEVVIDGLVHLSEGILPAWEAGADASGLEDLRSLWSCPSCHAFGLDSTTPEACPQCAQPLDARKVLRPAGFLGAKPPHVGYENLSHVAPDPARLSAQRGDWIALPADAGRMRADPEGLVATSSAGPEGGGFAVCLDCGRAEPMKPVRHGIAEPKPKAILRHEPLFRARRLKLTQDGLCPSANSPARIQPHIHLAQVKRSDVWEWQLPPGTPAAAALALAAGLREALTDRLGVEPDEIGPAVNLSSGPGGERLQSLFLHDTAAGGAGLSARMAEPEMLVSTLARAEALLDCPDSCLRGCPSCILRPDLNQRGVEIDRRGGLTLARDLRARLDLPEDLRIFGPTTRLCGQSAPTWLAARLRAGRIGALDLWLAGDPDDWDLSAPPLRRTLARFAEAGIRPRLYLPTTALTSAGFGLAQKLALHALGEQVDLHSCSQLPTAGGLPLILRLDGAEGPLALAAAHPADAVPGSDWGAGAEAPLLVGPAPQVAPGNRLRRDKFAELAFGNARLLSPARALDGPATGFGKRFWDWLIRHAPLEINALRTSSVSRLTYSDRYLLSPFTLRLATDLLRATPGAAQAAIDITLAHDDKPAADPRFLHHNFPADALRKEVLLALLPRATAALRAKADLPHHRALAAELADGRILTVILDQGLGSWRAESTVRHDFTRPAAQQAAALSSAIVTVRSETDQGAPLAVRMD